MARRIGKFEEANGGTLLLDEISELDPRLQAKLLRAIQEKEIDRVGGNKPIKVDIRLLATTNRDMEEAVRNGQFREDLYFRLNVVNVHLPPLRDRPRDVELLTDHFLKKYAEANGLPTPSISQEAMDALKAHDWPGNVRELENAIHRAVLLSVDGTVRPDSVQVKSPHPAPATRHPAAEPAGETAPAGGAGTDADAAGAGTQDADPASGAEAGGDADVANLVGRTVADVERDLILNTLEHTLGNRTHAANILGISIRTLRNKLKAYSQEGVRIPPANDAGQQSEYQRA